MSTKSMPGPFNCYAAALPDEPIFTILGRDPAGPATIKFWIAERSRLGKVETPDDIARLSEAYQESVLFADWRDRNLDPFNDGTPTWKLPRQIVTDEPPIRVEDAAMDVSVKSAILDVVALLNNAVSDTARHEAKVIAIKRLHQITDAIDDNVPVVPANWDAEDDEIEHDPPLIEALKAITVIAQQPEVKYDEWLKVSRIASVLLSQARQGVIAHQPMTQEFTAGFFRFGEETYTYERLAEIVRTFNQGIADKMPSNWHNPQDLKDIDNHSEVRRKIGCGIRQVAEDLRARAIKMVPIWREPMMEFVDRLNGHAAELDNQYTPGGTLKGFFDVPLGESYQPVVTDPPYVVPIMDGFMPEPDKIDNLKPGEKVVVDSAPEDLAHAPEVPQHRFSQFNKGEHYAYARGLEVNPSHLPTALDAMHKDGWELVSLFGQTNAPNVGFVFKRVAPQMYVVDTGIDAGNDEFDVERLRKLMTEPPAFDRRPLIVDTDSAKRTTDQLQQAAESFRDTTSRIAMKQHMGYVPKVEVHVEGLGPVEARALLKQIECRLQWLGLEGSRCLRVVGLIENMTRAAFDFTQADGRITRRSTLTNGDCGDMEFGRQQEP